MKNNQIFVVEGKNDLSRLLQVFPNINVISVNGSEILEDVLIYLKSIKNTHEIVIVTDPDYPGIKIRNELEQKLKKVSHIFLDREKSISKNKKKIGLEHLSDDDIKEAFGSIYKPSFKKQEIYDMSFLYKYKLVGHENSNNLRKELSDYFRLGHVNGKTLLKRLNMSNIKKEEVVKFLTTFLVKN